MKRTLIVCTAVLPMLAASAFAAPSAKFTAVYGNNGPYLTSMVEVTGTTVDATAFQQNEGFTFATIKVPQDKELLIGVSSEVGLTTDTSIKGKEGGKARAIAGASGAVIVIAHNTDPDCDEANGDTCNVVAQPGGITLASRVQQLDATLGGVYDCVDSSGDGVIQYNECGYTDEEIGLILQTVSANHFNFVAPNLDAGTYNVTAYFTTRTEATVCIDDSIVECDGFTPSEVGTVEARAYAEAFIGSYMVTVQQVRAVQGDIDFMDIDVELCSGTNCPGD